MSWIQLDWLSIWSFSSALIDPGVWECGSLINNPSLGLSGILISFMESDILLQSGEKKLFNTSTYNLSLIKTCAVSFFLDNIIGLVESNTIFNVFSLTNFSETSFFESNRILIDVNSFFWSYLWAGEILGNHLLNTTVSYSTWFNFFLSLDLFLILAELFVLCLVLFIAPRFGFFRVKRRNAYDDFVTFCQNNNISLTEFGAISTMMLGLVFFDFFLAFTEDDPTEIFSFFVLALALAGGLGLFFSLDIQYFYMISALGGGNAVLVAFNDLVANALCVLRIFLCWTRYIFYDIQVEALDWTFHYVEGFNEYTLGAIGGISRTLSFSSSSTVPSIWEAIWLPFSWLLLITLDLWVFAFQVLVGIFKYAIALFLMWLLFDLFWFRPLADSETNNLIVKKNK